MQATVEIEDKLSRLQDLIRSYGKVLVAFSGGCDSAFVLKVSREVLGRESVLAVIAQSPSLPESELVEARKVAEEIDIPLLVIKTQELEDPRYSSNPTVRCYYCKSELYSHLEKAAARYGLSWILNGTHQDDLGDWRPGLQAAREYPVRSPLVEAGFRKQDVRQASRQLGLSTWSKPQAACLSSRIPFGVKITRERLKQVEQGEEILKRLGFEVVRVRWFGETALIEVGTEETRIFFRSAEIRQIVLSQLRDIGFQRVDLNLQGYQPGRFNPQSSNLQKEVQGIVSR